MTLTHTLKKALYLCIVILQDLQKFLKVFTKLKFFSEMNKLIKEQVGFEANSFAVVSKGGEAIPAGCFMGGEEVPAGGWRFEQIPTGRFMGGEEVPKGGWRTYIKSDVYRTQDGRAYFEFGFAQVGSNVEIDILDMPGYGGRDENVHITHRLKSERGGYKICFGEPSISSDMHSAKKWAAQWAEHTWKYITTGKQFPNS